MMSRNTDKNEPPARQLSIDELGVLAGLPRRTVRYYIQRGLVDRPVGETRGAYYTERHLEQLLTVRRWTEAGLSLERIAALREGEEGALPPAPPRRPGSVEVKSHTLVAEGIELVVDPERAGLSPEAARALFEQVRAAYESIVKEHTDDE